MAETEIISGRKDFDVVAYDDYAHDMRELVDQALTAHESYRQEIRDLNRTIWQLVLASGGKVTINQENTYYDVKDIDWSIEDRPWEGTRVFKANIRGRINASQS